MSFTFDDGAMKQVLHIHRLMEKQVGRELTDESVHPLWYRGLSEVQLQGANRLSSALTNDMLQSTTYRVYRQLGFMGVSPRPKPRQLPLLYRMSRGNDVAFLWFLMEMFYKTDKEENIYGYNEQIIMSAIFLLDLYPTLYELDRVLPLPHGSAEVRERQAMAAARRRKLIEQEARLKAKKKKTAQKPPQPGRPSMHYKLPYFQAPVLFKPRRSKLLATYPKRAITLKELPPEPPPQRSPLWTRWFGDCSISEGQRVVASMLNKELHGIFASLKAAKLNTNHVETMCAHHSQIKAMEQSLHLNLEKLKQEKLRSLVDVDLRYRQQSRRRVLADLERLSKLYEDKFHRMAVRTRLASNRKRLSLDIHEPDFIYIPEGSDVDSMEDAKSQTENSCKPPRPSFHSKEWSEANPKSVKDAPPHLIYNPDTTLPLESLEARRSRLMQFLQQGGTETKQESTQAPAQSECLSCGKDCQYFEVGREASSYRFNYHRLFAPNNDKLLDNQQMRLKAEFIKALDDDVEYLNAILTGDQSDSVDKLVQRAVQKLFTTGTQIFDEHYSTLQTQNIYPKKRLSFERDYFDANDTVLMKEMLRLGLEAVAKDHRYVLPTLPNVHLVPLLMDWICTRYGKRYTLEESHLSFKKARYLMENVASILSHDIVRDRFNSLKISEISKHKSRAMVEKEIKNRSLRFINHFTLGIMELGRAFNSVMKNDQNHNTYYAYMPAHIRDIHFSKHITYINRRRRQ